MKIFDFFRRKKERKPVVLKDLTTFNLYRVNVERRDDDGALREAAELYLAAESSVDVNVRIRRLIRWAKASRTPSTLAPEPSSRQRFKEKTKMTANQPIQKSREF